MILNQIRINTSYCFSTEEQRGKTIIKSGMEQDRTGEYPPPEVFRCYPWSDVMLHTAYTHHEDDSGYPQQSIKKVVKFKMGSKCKHNQNNSIDIKLLCGRIRGSCLNTELNSAWRAVTGRMKPTHVEDLYLLSGIAPPAIRRYICARMERPNKKPMRSNLYMNNNLQREGWNSGTASCVVRNWLNSLQRSYGVMNGLGDYKQHRTKLLST